MYTIAIQLATDKTLVPKPSRLRKWAKQTLHSQLESAEITIRIVGVEEMTELNSTYRHKQGPTNVLSFPFAVPEEVELEMPLLGDIVICADVVNREADEQHKLREAHWAHMIVHGVFHLLGFDHEKENEAEVMEALEINIMQGLGFPNPYETGNIK